MNFHPRRGHKALDFRSSDIYRIDPWYSLLSRSTFRLSFWWVWSWVWPPEYRLAAAQLGHTFGTYGTRILYNIRVHIGLCAAVRHLGYDVTVGQCADVSRLTVSRVFCDVALHNVGKESSILLVNERLSLATSAYETYNGRCRWRRSFTTVEAAAINARLSSAWTWANSRSPRNEERQNIGHPWRQRFDNTRGHSRWSS